MRERTTQRTDSTHVLASVCDLTRLELVTEAVRAALEEVTSTSPHLLDELVDEDWGLRYGRPVRLGKNPLVGLNERDFFICALHSVPCARCACDHQNAILYSVMEHHEPDRKRSAHGPGHRRRPGPCSEASCFHRPELLDSSPQG
ncbi:hypothetical protein [Streptomyces bobili]|uniref:hypothetical protein n=1 Tax=Streptomyces bobili TaxID=67280 RepID=UPI00380D4560